MLNQIKTVLLLGILTSLMLSIGYFFGGGFGLTIAFIFVLIMNFVSYWWSDKIVLAMYRAKEIDKKEVTKLYNIVEDLCQRAKLPMPRLYLIPSDSPNAFATGRNKTHSVIAVTSGLLNLLDEDELKGVLSHELAHIKNNDILISTVAATIAGVISYIAMMARIAAIFGNRDDRGSNMLELLVLAFLAPFIALIIRLAISRSREYLADYTGAKFMNSGEPLSDALKKLDRKSRDIPMKFGNEATSSLFIVNPFSGRALINLFSTHPDVESRIDKLSKYRF